MVYRRTYRRTYRRRTNMRRRSRFSTRSGYRRPYRRYARKTNKISTVRIPRLIVPDRTLVRLKDSDIITTEAFTTPGAPGEYSVLDFYLRGNSYNLPFGNSSLSRPTGFDQWANFYSKYIINKNTVRITPIATTGISHPIKITIIPSLTNTIAAGVDPAELPNARSRVYTSNLFIAGAETQPQSQVSMNYTWNTALSKKVFGKTSIMNENNYWGTTAPTNPSTVWYWVVRIESLIPFDGVGEPETPSPLILQLDMYSKAVFRETVNIPDSDPVIDV